MDEMFCEFCLKSYDSSFLLVKHLYSEEVDRMKWLNILYFLQGYFTAVTNSYSVLKLYTFFNNHDLSQIFIRFGGFSFCCSLAITGINLNNAYPMAIK